MYKARKEPVHAGMPVFMKGRSTGYTVGNSRDKVFTALQESRKEGEETRAYSEEYSLLGVGGLHPPGAFLFGHEGDSGSAITTKTGEFVGMYFAGNDYTGTGYFTSADDLFLDIKRITSATEVELLPHPTEETAVDLQGRHH